METLARRVPASWMAEHPSPLLLARGLLALAEQHRRLLAAAEHVVDAHERWSGPAWASIEALAAVLHPRGTP